MQPFVLFTRFRAVGLILGLVILGCAPSSPSIIESHGVTPAQRVRLTPKITGKTELADRVDVVWTIDRFRADIIRGYNVYVGSDSILAIRPTGDPALVDVLFGGTHFPGDTDGDICQESITVDGLTSGGQYFIHVRTVFPDGSESPASNQERVLPRPRGTFLLVPRFQSGHDGFSFSEDGPAEGTSETNDLYMYTTGNVFHLASPDRLDRTLRATRFVDLGPSFSLDDHPLMPGSGATADRIAVEVGHSIGLVLADGRIAKVRPLGLDTDRDPPRITLEYVFQPTLGEQRF
jgi:hypothetical protein